MVIALAVTVSSISSWFFIPLLLQCGLWTTVRLFVVFLQKTKKASSDWSTATLTRIALHSYSSVIFRLLSTGNFGVVLPNLDMTDGMVPGPGLLEFAKVLIPVCYCDHWVLVVIYISVVNW
jgi:hypothetical protein